MPELPEVETILRGLKPRVLELSIRDVVIGDRRILQIRADRLKRAIRSQTIRGVSRRGKYLVFELDRHHLIFHFGMTGQLTYRDPEQEDSKGFARHPVTGLQSARQHPPDRHTHLHILLNEGKALLYRDIRKFGRVFLVAKKNQENSLAVFFKDLGLEPFTAEYSIQAFLEGFRNRKLRLKSLLLDQGFVAGIGNIYADEALFEARLHPARTILSLRRKEKARLFEAIPKVLEQGISFRGTSFRNYVNSDGEPGSYQEALQVYGRHGKACRRCGGVIQRIVISQRGTHFCPSCQPRSGRI